MPLTQEKRDSLDSNDFAVPETRQLPMHDQTHTRMAWQMVDRTKGLSQEQRDKARKRILRRAKELGMDTSDWNKDVKAAPDADENIDEQEISRRNQEYADTREHVNEEFKPVYKAFNFSALAMQIPDATLDHPNKMPFAGVLTKLDEPSNNPLSGSDGKCVVLPKDVAEKALSSLLGMAIDFTPHFDGHDTKSKIGIITSANIVGNELKIQGYFYGADFPSEVKRIQAEKAQLGFSYEAQVQLKSMNDDPLVIKDCVFTGAAVLYKDKAAYTTTSLAASKEQDIMNDEIKKMLESLQAKIDGLEKKVEASAEEHKKVAAGSVSHMVAPHTAAIRNCAAGMEAAGLGMHASQGHVAHLNKMADHMDAEAAMGKLPNIYQTPDFYSASADKKFEAKSGIDNEQIKKLQETIDVMASKITDMEKAKFEASQEPQRQTLSPSITKLLAKGGIDPTDEKQKLTANEFDKLIEGKNLTIQQRIAMKRDLQLAGKLN